MISLGSCFGGIFSGLVANANSDWRWVLWMDAILSGLCLLIVVMLQAETNFERPPDSEDGAGLDASEFDALRSNARTFQWTRSLSVVEWYDRSVERKDFVPRNARADRSYSDKPLFGGCCAGLTWRSGIQLWCGGP